MISQLPSHCPVNYNQLWIIKSDMVSRSSADQLEDQSGLYRGRQLCKHHMSLANKLDIIIKTCTERNSDFKTWGTRSFFLFNSWILQSGRPHIRICPDFSGLSIRKLPQVWKRLGSGEQTRERSPIIPSGSKRVIS